MTAFFPLAQADWQHTRVKVFFRHLPLEVRNKITAQLTAHNEAQEFVAARTRIRVDQQAEHESLAREVWKREGEMEIAKNQGLWRDEDQFDLDELKARLERVKDQLGMGKPDPKFVKPPKTDLMRSREFQSLETPLIGDWIQRRVEVSTARFAYAPANPKGWTPEKAELAIDDLIVKERFAVARMKTTKADAIAAARAAVDEMARQGAPNLRDVVRTAGDVEWPKDVFFTADLGRSLEAQYGVAFQCWLNPDAVKARLTAEINASFGSEAGISESDRRKRLAEIDARWLDLQRILEACWDRDEAAGKPVERRALHPLAMLVIEPTESAPAKEPVYGDPTGIPFDPVLGRTPGAPFKTLADQNLLPQEFRTPAATEE